MEDLYVKHSNYIDSSLVDEINECVSKGFCIDKLFGRNMYYNSYCRKYKEFIGNIFKNKDIFLLKELKKCNFKLPIDYYGGEYIKKYQECLFEDEIDFLNKFYEENDFKDLFSHHIEHYNRYESEKEEWRRQKRRMELNGNTLLKRVEKSKKQNMNIGKLWSMEEEDILWLNIQKKSIDEVAKLHKRTSKEIKLKLQKIILEKIYNDELDCNEIKKYIKYVLGDELKKDDSTINGDFYNELIKNIWC